MPDKVNLEEIRERERKATKGPWANEYNKYFDFKCIKTPDGFVDSNFDNADLDFIAHARQDIPDLLALVEEATAIIISASQHYKDCGFPYSYDEAEAWLGKVGK